MAKGKQTKNYVAVIGLEVHVEVKTKSKMFCGCPADPFGREPNSATCPVCLGLPGALPVPNRLAIEKTVSLAKTLGCSITNFSHFERKNYFYPDLSKSFQISQYAGPVGALGNFEGITVRRVHLEEDTGKLLHEADKTLIDFNRSGVPLIEIVTEPEFSDPEKVSNFLKNLRTLVTHHKISDADMEKGSMRLEANISLKEEGAKELPPYKVELKNINSFAFLKSALEFEIKRQEEILRGGAKVLQETRGYDSKKGETFSQRVKEEAFDYRYFPEPDIPPLTGKSLKGGEEVPSLSSVKEEYQKMGLPENYVKVFLADRQLAEVFAELKDLNSPKEAANIIVNKRFGDPKKVAASELAAAYKVKEEKTVLSEEEMRKVAEKVLLDNPGPVSDYAKGQQNARQFLFGKLMKEAAGKIDPKSGQRVLQELLDART